MQFRLDAQQFLLLVFLDRRDLNAGPARNDVFNVSSSPAGGSGVTWSIDGGAPTVPPGDRLVFNAQNQPVTLTPSSIQSDSNKVLSFASIETFIVNNASGAQAPSFTSTTSTSFTAGTPGSFTVTIAPGAYPGVIFSETGNLPSGVTFSQNGVLSGTPAVGTGGTWNIVIDASNGVSPDATQNFTLTVFPASAPVVTIPSEVLANSSVWGQPGVWYLRRNHPSRTSQPGSCAIAACSSCSSNT